MLEATPIPRMDRLPWSAGGHGLDIIDREGDVLFHANQMYAFSRLAWSDRIVATQQRCVQVAAIVNAHDSLCASLAELIAIASAAYRMLADLDADILTRSDWACVIQRAAETLQRTKQEG